MLDELFVEHKHPNYECIGRFLNGEKRDTGDDNRQLNQCDKIDELLILQNTNRFQIKLGFRSSEDVFYAPTIQVHRHNLLRTVILPDKVGKQPDRLFLFQMLMDDESEFSDIVINCIVVMIEKQDWIHTGIEIVHWQILPSFFQNNIAIFFNSCDKSHVPPLTQFSEEPLAVIAAIEDLDTLSIKV